MKTIVRLAVRNLGRNLRRTALTVAIVALGTWAIVVMWGMVDGFLESTVRSQITLDTGDMQIHRHGYLDDPNFDLNFTFEAAEAITNDLMSLSQIEVVSPRLETEGMLQSSYGLQGVQIRGIDIQLEPQVTQIRGAIVDGALLDQPGQILMGRALAENLDIRLGERVILQVQGVERARSKGFRLAGVLNTGLISLDQHSVFIPFDDAIEITEAAGPSELALSLRNRVDERAFQPSLQDRLGEGLSVSTFYTLNPIFTEMMAIANIEMVPMMLLLAVLVGFGVANTINFTVFQRTRQFGVMLAIGLQPGKLSKLVVLESLLTSFLGFVVGTMLGLGVNLYFEQVGMDFGFYSEVLPELGMPQILYFKASWWHAMYGLAVVIVTAVFAARFPARRAARLEPTEAMRHV